MRLPIRPIARAFGFALLSCVPLIAQTTRRVSLSSSGAQGDGDSGSLLRPRLSADGRFMAFPSLATNLVPGDTNARWDLFVRDLQDGLIERVSVDSSGLQSNGDTLGNSITPDGRYVAFECSATNLVPGDTNAAWDAFLRDRQSGTTTLLSLDSSGIQGNDDSFDPEISADGRFVAFDSTATNLVPGDTNGSYDVFVRDVQAGTTELMSVDSAGIQGNDDSFTCVISADGRFVAFTGNGNNLVPGDTNGSSDVFVRDRQLGTTERVSVDSSGNQGSGGYSAVPTLSADGRFVAFLSIMHDLVPGDTNAAADIFVRDRQLGTTERVSVATGGIQSNGWSTYGYISGDGRYVAFQSSASNLVAGDTNGRDDTFVHDRQTGTTERVSISSAGCQGNFSATGASLSFDGRYVGFNSHASNLVPADTNGARDVFLRDRLGGTDFASLCDAGIGGVIACPCANPPGAPGRGCDNSSATGGAILTATGATSLSSDNLVFTTSGEKPTALSIVSQWTGVNPTGAVFGQGVRCTSGTLKRLYNKAASGGSITAPNFGAGDPQVSVRSAALGDTILAGQSRWYLVYYRDPIVLGGCPPTSTFNATQTGEVAWTP